MKDEIDIASLARKVLSFFGLALRWTPGAKQIWMIEIMTGELVTAFIESPTSKSLGQPFDVAGGRILLKSSLIYDSETVYRTFIESLGSIKKWSYGLDVETLKPKKILDNPFFNHGSLEEIAVKLDLLVPEEKKEDDNERSCTNS